MPCVWQGTTEKLSYSSIFNPLIRRSTLYCNPVLLLGSISSAPRSVLAHYFGFKYNTGCGRRHVGHPCANLQPASLRSRPQRAFWAR